MASSFKRTTLVKAAEDMFTAKGEFCPIAIMERGGKTYLINREIMRSASESNGSNGSSETSS